MNTYDFKTKDKESLIATKELARWMTESLGCTLINVEKNKHWQKMDVDYLVTIPYENKSYGPMHMAEVKVDKYYKTGNFFFETISCVETGSTGCFLYTKSDYIYYYYPEEKEVFSIPTKEAQAWFKANQSKFKTVRVQSRRYNGEVYHTEGCLVPRDMIMKALNIGSSKLN